MERCFLCDPDPTLVYAEGEHAFALCGLGPIVRGYSVVASRKHVRSAADILNIDGQGFLSFAGHVRSQLIDRYGSCLLTEHGRMPVCATGPSNSELHCYHAHFLMFPRVPAIVDVARGHFHRVSEASSTADALATAVARKEEYFLISDGPDRACLMTGPRANVRQFARYLVAESLGMPELADWRNSPNRETAAEYARELRSTLGGAQQ